MAVLISDNSRGKIARWYSPHNQAPELLHGTLRASVNLHATASWDTLGRGEARTMADDKNLYHLMLNLPEDVTSPDHYQLLGLEQFEDDEKAIRDAAIDANRELLKWQNSDYHRECDHLMDEVVAARETLLDAQRKAEYDRELRRRVKREQREPNSDFDRVFLIGLAGMVVAVVLVGLAIQFWGWATVAMAVALVTGSVVVAGLACRLLWRNWGVIGSWLLRLLRAIRFWPRISGQRRTVLGIAISVFVLLCAITLVVIFSLRRVPVPEEPVESLIAQPEQRSVTEETANDEIEPKVGSKTAGPSKPSLLLSPFNEQTAKQSQRDWAEYLKTEVTIENGVGMKLVLIPAGEFLMGSPEDEAGRYDNELQHRIRITKPFYVQTTEVTQGQWESVMETRPWSGREYVKKGSNYAATFVSWDDAQDFCRRLTEKEGVTYRLPTEAEWEYACRAGTTTAYSFGDDASRLGEYTWFDGNAYNLGESYSHQVALKTPNAFGLHDMHGNVLERCQDWSGSYNDTNSAQDDPVGPPQGSLRVYRGGSWMNSDCRSAKRYGHWPDFRDGVLGFRVARGPVAATGSDNEAVAQTLTSGESHDDQPAVAEGVDPASARADAPKTDANDDSDAEPAPTTDGLKLPTIKNSIGMKLVLIPAGEFLMGSPKDEAGRSDDELQHRIRITKPLYVGQTEVTQDQWESVMETKPWSGKAFVKAGPEYAATYVSWDDAQEFCRRLSEKEGATYRLPTEAEWEYACRAGTTTVYSFGDDASRLGEYAWVSVNASSAAERYAHQVGLKKANAFGLYDMHGNLWEWCQDWHGEGYYTSSPRSDPVGPSYGSFRVIRGGGWGDRPQYCRSALRYRNTPADRFNSLGFRVALGPVR